MSDFLGDRECVTHHACDCIQTEVERLRAALREIADATYSGDPYDGGLLWQHVERLQGVAEAALLDGAA